MYKNTFRRAQTLKTTLEKEFTKELRKSKSFLSDAVAVYRESYVKTITSKKEESGDLIFETLMGQLELIHSSNI